MNKGEGFYEKGSIGVPNEGVLRRDYSEILSGKGTWSKFVTREKEEVGEWDEMKRSTVSGYGLYDINDRLVNQ